MSYLYAFIIFVGCTGSLFEFGNDDKNATTRVLKIKYVFLVKGERTNGILRDFLCLVLPSSLRLHKNKNVLKLKFAMHEL